MYLNFFLVFLSGLYLGFGVFLDDWFYLGGCVVLAAVVAFTYRFDVERIKADAVAGYLQDEFSEQWGTDSE